MSFALAAPVSKLACAQEDSLGFETPPSHGEYNLTTPPSQFPASDMLMHSPPRRIPDGDSSSSTPVLDSESSLEEPTVLKIDVNDKNGSGTSPLESDMGIGELGVSIGGGSIFVARFLILAPCMSLLPDFKNNHVDDEATLFRMKEDWSILQRFNNVMLEKYYLMSGSYQYWVASNRMFTLAIIMCSLSMLKEASNLTK